MVLSKCPLCKHTWKTWSFLKCCSLQLFEVSKCRLLHRNAVVWGGLASLCTFWIWQQSFGGSLVGRSLWSRCKISVVMVRYKGKKCLTCPTLLEFALLGRIRMQSGYSSCSRQQSDRLCRRPYLVKIHFILCSSAPLYHLSEGQDLPHRERPELPVISDTRRMLRVTIFWIAAEVSSYSFYIWLLLWLETSASCQLKSKWQSAFSSKRGLRVYFRFRVCYTYCRLKILA